MKPGQKPKYASYLLTLLKKVYGFVGVAIYLSIFIFAFRNSLPVIAATYVDNSQSTFNAGSYTFGPYTRLQWSNTSGGNILNSAGETAKTGTYTSSQKNPGFVATWQTISWVPAAPYGKELPDNGVSETVYSTGNANMSNVEALLHFNESSGSTTFADSSGQGVNFSCSVSCPTVTTGKFNNAWNFASASNQYLTTTTNLSNLVGGSDTVAYWIKTTQVGNDTFWQAPGVLGIEQDGAGNDIFYGTLDSQGRIHFEIGDAGNVSSTNPVNDGNWHLIVMSRDAVIGTTKIYVDGALNQTAILGPFTIINQPFYSIGRIENTNSNISPVYYNGAVDELSIYGRVLSDAEVTNMYNRGVERILFQTRSCPTSGCSGISFTGPAGTTTDYYSELSGAVNTLPTKTLVNNGSNQYFQYQFTEQVDDSTVTPILRSVTINYISAQPSLAFTIRKNDDTSDTNVCDLGSASVASVVTCSYRLKVTTNAIKGYVIYISTQGGLKNGTTSITDAAQGSAGSGGTDISNTTAGTEAYGAVINAGSTTGTGTISLGSRFNAGGTKAVSYNVASSTALVTSTGTNSPTTPDTTNTVLVTHKLNIGNATPSGYYTQVITYTASPSF
jgi:hypothetical protein